MSPRTTVLQIRLSVEEKRFIRESAKRAGLPMAAWMRLVLLSANPHALNANLRDLWPIAKTRKK